MEIARNVNLINVGDYDYYDGFTPMPNVYLVTGTNSAVFIDTGYGKDEELAAYVEGWRAAGSPTVSNLVLTHRHGDHIGGALKLRDAVGGAITCSVVEQPAIDADLGGPQVGKTVGDGERIDLGGATLEFIYTPGHTMGSICVYHHEEQVLFTGDSILGSSTTVISPDHGDMGAYIDSMRKLLSYEAKLIAPGHGPMVSETRAKVEDLITHRLEREQQIVDLVENGTGTIDAMFERLYPGLDERLHNTAKSQIRSHLTKLERDGRVSLRNERYSLIT